MKTINWNKIIAVLCVLVMLAGFLTVILTKCSLEPDHEDAAASQEKSSVVTADGILEISKYGNVKLDLSHSDVLEAFEYGDILTVSFGSVSVDVPLGKNFSDVDSDCPGLFLQMDGDTQETELAVNMGNFAETYGIAEKIVHEDKSYEWQYCDEMSEKTAFTITLKEKAGYLEQFTIRSMTYTDEREDYPELTDAQYANFRPVAAGKIGKNVLFRSSSPINPEHGRSTYADAAAAEAKVTVFIDLTDSEASVPECEGFEGSYFAKQKYAAVAASMDFTAEENTKKIAEAFRFMAENPGVYCVFCDEGKNRTGIAAALLESLMGASYDEVAQDYMQSFVNYYKIGPDDEVYTMTLNGNLNKSLTAVFGTDPQTADLQQEAEKYLASIGMTEDEIAGLKKNLKG